MVIPELIRLLTERGVELERAMDLVERTCATPTTPSCRGPGEMACLLSGTGDPQLLPFYPCLDERARKRSDAPKLAIWDAHDVIHMARFSVRYFLFVL